MAATTDDPTRWTQTYVTTAGTATNDLFVDGMQIGTSVKNLNERVQHIEAQNELTVDDSFINAVATELCGLFRKHHEVEEWNPECQVAVENLVSSLVTAVRDGERKAVRQAVDLVLNAKGPVIALGRLQQGVEGACHLPIFDEEAARGLDAHDVRRHWPRFDGTCAVCGWNGIAYASNMHYISGDW